jgi:[glutamine synthetase] adenylyltransferase / [glutamine synthetase]-adenylyl-L-tyrosine phosphorylase
MNVTDVTQSDLIALGFTDPDRARRILLSLAGQGVTDDDVAALLPSLFDALRKSPDPDRGLNNFSRWTDSVTSRYTHFQYLLRHPAALDIFFNVCGVSQLFSDILIRNPEYFEILANPGVRSGAKSGGALYRELSGFIDSIVRPELKLEALRRFRQREMLRIGTRDILELADMPTTAREFSNLADACVQKCYEIAVAQLAERYGIQTPPPFAVIAMGKLGGQELNYSSDIDLMFICGDEDALTPHGSRITQVEYAHKLAEQIVNGLSKNLQNGHLFRVDMRLRPEGRFGALVRTLSSYRAYYESWAEPWERQALIKARPIAGDTRLGELYAQMVVPYVYRRSVTSEFVEATRENKARIEKKAEMEGQTHTNVKVGFGGIRDVEFTAQLLQLEQGGRNPLLRTPNTLEALARLRQAGVLTTEQASELSEDYQFLRTVEHRLQILYELQTQSLPTEPNERRLLARRLGYPDTDAFNSDYTRRTERVRGHFLSLFGERRTARADDGDSWSEVLTNVETPTAQGEIVKRLGFAGFTDPARAYSALKTMGFGGDYGRAQPEARQLFQKLASPLIAASGHTGDPDAALLGIETMALAAPNPAAFYQTLLEGTEVLDRMCRLAAGSLPLMQSLAKHLQWMDMLVSDEVVDPGLKTAEQSAAELEERLAGVKTAEQFWDGVALYMQRERLRIGARDLWGEISATGVTRELTALAEAVLQVLLGRTVSEVAAKYADANARRALESVALIGLGKLGGRELGYGSDWDILIVYGDEHAGQYAVVNALAEALLSVGQEMRTRGAPVEIDARLRPEGRFGALARTVAEHEVYYRDTALTWERQVLTKARRVAGNLETAAAYMRVVQDQIYSRPLPLEAREQVITMKRRIETERLKPEERYRDVKLGHGGMSDIEFTAQLWQMVEGPGHADIRTTSTTDALHALGGAGSVPAPDAARLAETYGLWTAIRNRLALMGGLPTDTLPADSRRVHNLAIGLGFVASGSESAEQILQERFEERMRETRSIVERLFYDLPMRRA